MSNVTRQKNKKNQLEIKRFDTKISTIEKQYDINLGVRGDMKFGNYLKKVGYPSLSKMLSS